MSEKPTINVMTLQKSIQEALKKPHAKEACLSFEYKLILIYSAQFGIYVMPQLDTLDIWHGVLFVRYGFFKDAKFKFRMIFEQFPLKPPKVVFTSQIFHPMVNAETGELDLGEQLNKNWNYGTEHLVFTIVEHIRMIFVDTKKYQVTDSFNRKASELFKSNVDQFFIKVRECVETSKAQVYTNAPDSTLKFLPFNERHKKIKDSLTQVCEDQSLSQQEKRRKFLKSLRE